MVLARVSDGVPALDEVRLPLHILLENRFGDLNENQEEMLAAAQSAVDQAAAMLGCVRLIADLDRGALEPRRDLLRLDDLISGHAAGPARGGRTSPGGRERSISPPDCLASLAIARIFRMLLRHRPGAR